MHLAVQYPLERVVPPEGTEICDFNLPPGTIVSVNPYVVHRDPGVFGLDAAEFRPERWLESTPEQLITMERSFMAVSSKALFSLNTLRKLQDSMWASLIPFV